MGHKMLWYYMLDRCNAAGIWYVDLELAGFIIGITFNEEQVLLDFKKQIHVLNPTRWLFPSFITFQYGGNLKKSTVRVRVVKLLKAVELDINALSIQYGWGIDTPEEEEEEEEEVTHTTSKHVRTLHVPTLEEVAAYCQERDNGVSPKKWLSFYEAKGWMIGKNKMKDWKAAVRTWEKDEDMGFKSKYDTPEEDKAYAEYLKRWENDKTVNYEDVRKEFGCEDK